LRVAAAELEDTWNRFKAWGDRKARDELIARYAYLVKITAGRVVTSLPPNVERDDLVGAGVMGLIKAIDQFDTGRQVKFETYAIALIRGAILEMLREEDWVPRSIRERVKLLERAYLDLEGRLGRPASDEEMAEELGIELDTFHGLLADTSRASLLSLDDIVLSSDGNEKIHLADVVNDESADTIAEVEIKEMKSALGVAIDRLPDREKLVIALYYYEGLTFKEIGKILTVSESRVYQLHTQAVLRLRGYLQRDVALFHK
jgi:RNA polymerase sigma factor FliA